MTTQPDKRPPLDLAAMRADYQGWSLSVPEIAAKYKISRRQIYVIAHTEGWTLRSPRRVDKNDLAQRMLRMLDRQITQLEDAMTDQYADKSVVLGKLAATLDRLIALDKATARTPARRAESKVMQDIRQKVAERLEHFGL